MDHKYITVVTVQNDLHALAIQKAFENYSNVTFDIIEANQICGSGEVTWTNANLDAPHFVLPGKDRPVNVRNIDIIWWRRVNSMQIVPDNITNPAYIDLINNDCRSTLIGMLLNEFDGTWISHPAATTHSENKLVQLKVAQQAGFRVPCTLISQSPSTVREFCRRFNNEVIIKPVKGTLQAPVFTMMMDQAHLDSDVSIKLCPAIYQEYIQGNHHLRVSCFGEKTYAVLIETDELDWRRNLDIPVREYQLSGEVQARLQHVLRVLHLKMGVFDLKLTPDGDVVWLEVNPQGQFLFTGLLQSPLAASSRPGEP